MSKTVGTILSSKFISCNDGFEKLRKNAKKDKQNEKSEENAKEKVNQNITTIIGIDPGLKNLGIGIIKIDISKIGEASIIGKKKKITIFEPPALARCVVEYAHLLLKIKQARKIEEKLWFIFETLDNLFQEHIPNLVIVEDAFVGINKNSALKLGLARGCILSVVGKHGTMFQTLAPKLIKAELTGNGAAQKEDIQTTFHQLLKNWPENMQFDSSDALAAAFCGIKILHHAV